ncbi:MAG: fibronectin type III domain-containing protein [Planctomycetota bacterium]
MILQRTFSVTLDPPSAIEGFLTASTQSASEIIVTRNVKGGGSGSQTPPDEWRVFRSFDGIDYVAHDSIPGIQNSYQDTDLVDGTNHWYHWRPWTVAAGLGHTTNGTSSVTVLPAPTNVMSNIISPGNVQVTWANNATTQTAFRIERAIGTGAFVEVASAAGDAEDVTFTDTGVNGTYQYRVIAENSVNFSAPSVSASATSSTLTLNVGTGTNNQVNLDWDNVAGGSMPLSRSIGIKMAWQNRKLSYN